MNVEIIKIGPNETHDGKARWDVLIDGQWDSSWDRLKDAKDRAKRMSQE